MIKSHLLYQLSYRGDERAEFYKWTKRTSSDLGDSPKLFDTQGGSLSFSGGWRVGRVDGGRGHFSQSVEIKLLHFRSGPRCFAEKCQARLDAGVVSEATNRDRLPHFFPARVCDELVKNHCKSHTMQRIVGVSLIHMIGLKRGLPVGMRS